jgi:hypothetical protein
VGEAAAAVGGKATVLEGCGAVTVLEGRGEVEAVGFGGGKFTEEEVLTDPVGTRRLLDAVSCRPTTPMSIPATARKPPAG